jgi:small conductance mechanosensitive channel
MPTLLLSVPAALDTVADDPTGAVVLAAARILLIVVLALLARRLAGVLINRVMARVEAEGEKSSASTERVSLRATTLGGVLGTIATAVVATLAVLTILGQVGVSIGPLLAGAGVIGLALGFGAQRLVQDFLSGIFMLLEDQYGVGDIVDTGEAIGTVEGLSLRLTRVRDLGGTLWHIPNGDIRRVGNFTRDWARAVVDVDVAYAADVGRATEVIKAAADEAAGQDADGAIVAEPEVWGVQTLGDNAVTVRLVAQTAPSQQWAVERALRARVKAALDAAGIEIPFPQRTVWVRPEEPQERAGGTQWSPTSLHPDLAGSGGQ